MGQNAQFFSRLRRAQIAFFTYFIASSPPQAENFAFLHLSNTFFLMEIIILKSKSLKFSPPAALIS